jgi:hypothetical protein
MNEPLLEDAAVRLDGLRDVAAAVAWLSLGRFVGAQVVAVGG